MEYQLSSCVWEITLACCFACKYCGSKGGRARDNELTTEECLDVADQLASLGCRRVSLIGGEVFMRRDWDVIAKRLSSRGVRVSIVTNGYMFSPALIRTLQDAGVESIGVSIDGTRETHDKYRQNGSFDRAVQAILTLSGSGIPVSVITTLHHENAEELEQMYEIFRQLPVWAWQLQACSPMGNAAASNIDYRFDPRAVISFIERNSASAPFVMGIADNIGYYTESEGSLRGNGSGKAYFRGCRAGLTAIGIDSVGNVRGCESMYDDVFNEGNLRDRTLSDIWNDPNSFSYNRQFTVDRLTGPCRECEFGPYCAGGCRSYNYFTHRKLYEAPACARVLENQEMKGLPPRR